MMMAPPIRRPATAAAKAAAPARVSVRSRPPWQDRTQPMPALRPSAPPTHGALQPRLPQSQAIDHSDGGGAPLGVPRPRLRRSAAPAPPNPITVDAIDIVFGAAGAISGFPAITSGDLNTPGPFNNAVNGAVKNAHHNPAFHSDDQTAASRRADAGAHPARDPFGRPESNRKASAPDKPPPAGHAGPGGAWRFPRRSWWAPRRCLRRSANHSGPAQARSWWRMRLAR